MTPAHYCLECGTPLTIQFIEQRPREVCPQCGWIHWEQVKLSAGCLVENAGMVLLVQRAHDPWRGRWHLPSGFVEVDEDPRQAAEREVREETRLNVTAGELVNAYLYQDDPRGNGVILIYRSGGFDGTPAGSPETLDCRFFSPSDLAGLPLAGVSGEQEVADWLAAHSNGKNHD